MAAQHFNPLTTAVAFASLGLLLGTEPLLAQPALEEVLVTARKREESLQNAPMSIKALGALELERRNITTLSDLEGAVPNLSVKGSISRNNAGVFIRGVGQADRSITLDPGVGLYINGVYLARMQGGMLDLLDIERIEVLRGPQGTLYGRNTIGGAVNIIPSKPSETAGLKVRVGTGNYDLVDAGIVADLPLVEDTLYSRLSVGYTDREGFTTNVLNGEKWDDKNYLGLRGDLRWLASDDVTVDLSLDWSKRRQESSGAQCVLENPNAPLMQLADRVLRLGYADACAEAQALGDLRFAVDASSRDDSDEWGFAATLEWELSDSMVLKSITSFRRLEWALDEEFDGSRLPVYHSRNDSSWQEQYSQEFQLAGDGLGGDLQWTMGLYLFSEDVERPAFSDFFLLNQFSERIRSAETESYALYGQASYNLTDHWILTGGLRYTYEDRSFANQEILLPNGTITDEVEVGDDFSAVTPMVNLAWHPTDTVMAYLNFSQGFKSGGFNARPDASQPESLEPYDEETVDSYEIGVKSRWLEDRVTANLALFRSDYEDMQLNNVQVSSSGNPLSIIRNAGESVIEGVELDVEALVTEGWRLSLGYGYTSAEYKEYATLNPATGQIEDLTHLEFANTPKHSLKLSSDWVLPLSVPGLHESRLRIDYSYTEGYYNDVENTEALRRDDTNILNAALILAFNEDRTRLQLWGKNLTDEVYYRAGFSLGASFGAAQRFFSEPRTYGVTLTHEL